MKKRNLVAASVLTTSLMLSSCGITANGSDNNNGGNILSEVLGNMGNVGTVGNVLGSVLGIDKPSERDIIGSWHYSEPGVAFTSKNALAKAGGEVAAAQAKAKLEESYRSVGFRRDNTQLTFNSNKTFNARLLGKTFNGTWTYDNNEQKITLKTLLFTIPVYAKRTTSGMSYLMESKKLLTILQTVSALSGNNTLQTVGDLSKNYDGIRMGFEMKK